MANKQTIIAYKIRAFVGANNVTFFNKKGGFTKYISEHVNGINDHCVFCLEDPLLMEEDRLKDFSFDCDMMVEDIKAEIGLFRYDLSHKMPVSLSILLARRGYDSPMYGRSLLSSGQAVISLRPLVEEYDRTHPEPEDDQPF